MKKEWTTNRVVGMDPEEIILFQLYRNQANRVGGLSRDSLPYSPTMTLLSSAYNQQINASLTEGEVWERLRTVLKCGEKQIETYLRSRGIGFLPKP